MKFSELVDISELQKLSDSFVAMTGMAIAMLDLEGNILIASGWQDICTRFYRVHPTTACRCRESDTLFSTCLEKDSHFKIYKCQNGLNDIAIPIKIGGIHVANLFTGQLLLETPDLGFFLKQAEDFGFDKKEFLNALGRVPILSEERVKSMAEFFSHLAKLIGEMGFGRISSEVANSDLRKKQECLGELIKVQTDEILEINTALRTKIAESAQAETALREREEKHGSILRLAMDGYWLADIEGRLLEVNQAYCAMSGYTEQELLSMRITDLDVLVSADYMERRIQKIKEQGSSSLCVGNGLYCSSNPLFGGFPELCSLKLFLAWPLASSPPGKSRRSTFPRNQTVSI